MRKNVKENQRTQLIIMCFPSERDLLPGGHIQSITFIVQRLIKFIFTCFAVPSGPSRVFSILYKVSRGSSSSTSRERENFVTTQFSHILFCREIHSELCYTYIEGPEGAGLMKIIIRPFSNTIPTKFVPCQFSLFNAIFRISCCLAPKRKLCFAIRSIATILFMSFQRLYRKIFRIK